MSTFVYTSTDGFTLTGDEVLASLVNSASKILPTNLITNGTFQSDASWTKDATWTISGGKASVINNSGGTDYLDQVITFPTAGTYLVGFECANYDVGALWGTHTAGTATYTQGSYNNLTSTGIFSRLFYVTVAGTMTVRVGASNGTVASVDNVFCYDVNADTIGDDATELNTSANAAAIGTEANATTDFTDTNCTLTSVGSPVQDGSYAISAETNTTPTDGGRIRLNLAAAPYSLVDDQMYTVSFYIRHVGTGGTWQVRMGDTTTAGTDYITIANILVSDTTYTQHSLTFRYDSDRQYFVVREVNASNDGGVYIDALSIKKSNNLIENGTFVYSGSSSEAGIGWTKGTGWSIASGVATITTPGATSDLEQTVTFPAAGTYQFSMNISAISGGNISLPITTGTAVLTSETFADATTTGVYHRKIYIHSAGTVTLKIRGTSAVTATIDDVTCYRIEDDISAADDNGLEIHGELYRQAVAPGAELRAFSGFNADNYLVQPYTSAMDFGTGDFIAEIWANMTAASGNALLFSRGAVAVSGFGAWYYVTTNHIKFRLAAGTNFNVSHTPTGYHKYTFQRVSGVIYTYIDGVLGGSVAKTNDVDVTAPLYVGGGGYYTNAGGVVSLLKISATTKTAAQIKANYDSEKTLFEYGAPYAQVGIEKTLSIPMRTGSSRGESDKKYTRDTLTQARQTLFYSGKDTFSPRTVPVPYISATQADYFAVKHLINSVKRGQTFTFTERGEFDSMSENVSVILTSSNHSASRESNAIDLYTFRLSMREA